MAKLLKCFSKHLRLKKLLHEIFYARSPVWWRSARFEYSAATALKEEPYWGRLAVYGGGGYTQLLPNTSAAFYQVLIQLQVDEWIDAGTRAVFVDFTTYNANVNLFAVTRSLHQTYYVSSSSSSRSIIIIIIILTLGRYVCRTLYIHTVYFNTYSLFQFGSHRLDSHNIHTIKSENLD